MKKSILIGVSAFIAGVLLTAALGWFAAPGAMMIESESNYGFEESVQKFEESVAAQGWKIPATHDLKATMAKFDHDVLNVKVFELCQPDHANAILQEDDERIVSSLMPCRVAIYEKSDGKVYISRMNSSLMSSMMGGLIKEVMTTAAYENEVILEAIID